MGRSEDGGRKGELSSMSWSSIAEYVPITVPALSLKGHSRELSMRTCTWPPDWGLFRPAAIVIWGCVPSINPWRGCLLEVTLQATRDSVRGGGWGKVVDDLYVAH